MSKSPTPMNAPQLEYGSSSSTNENSSHRDGNAILRRALRIFESRLSADSAVRQGMPPGSIRGAFDFRGVADEVVPSSPILRASIAKALEERTGWAVEPSALIPAVTRWLRAQLETCLRQIWASQTVLTIRVTRTSISIKQARGHVSPRTGRLPSCQGR
ncbi:hypothetical protein GGP85_003135 [Salinibacter ruber]|nr:hypothetical protein [Salinibacter ruber]MCS4185044.1 hypothetical protein [Salinibacter ruber]